MSDPNRILGTNVPDLLPKSGGHLGHPTWVGSGVLVSCGAHGAKTGLVEGETSTGRLNEILVREGRLGPGFFGGGGDVGVIIPEQLVDVGLQPAELNSPRGAAKTGKPWVLEEKTGEHPEMDIGGGGQPEQFGGKRKEL